MQKSVVLTWNSNKSEGANLKSIVYLTIRSQNDVLCSRLSRSMQDKEINRVAKRLIPVKASCADLQF
jgi:hypothetical protein